MFKDIWKMNKLQGVGILKKIKTNWNIKVNKYWRNQNIIWNDQILLIYNFYKNYSM